jgi:RNA-directed DNA polymerase
MDGRERNGSGQRVVGRAKGGGKKMLNEVTMERVVSPENMRAAHLAVKANGGAPGVDGMEVQEMEKHLHEHWEKIQSKLLEGRYQPAAVRAVEIPKASGGVRGLGIPTVLDRMIQQAIHQEMGPTFEEGFSENSYGFRPGRSAHDAVRAGQGFVASGKKWVVEIDLKSFFDQVNHDRLMTMIGRKVRDKRVLSLIGRYLRAEMQRGEGSREARGAGTPQGGPLSPLLANIYLDPLDKELEKRGVSFVRYADDITIFVSSPRSAERILESVVRWLKKELGLEVNREKSGTGPSDQSSLLGFRLYEDGKIGVSPKAVAKLKEEVKECWDARQSKSSRELREQWQNYIRGWWNYFQLADRRWEVKDLSGWMRRHMRKCFWQRWHHPRGRLNALKRLGVKGRVLGMAYSGLGAWAIARHWVMQQALKTNTLNQYGFILPWELAESGH